MERELKIGMIGLDTSHCQAFTGLLNDPSKPYHIPGGKVTTAFPGGSPDFEMSFSRLEKFTNELRDEYEIEMVSSPEEVAERTDAILLTSVDGRIHLPQFERIAHYGKPVFIDKPLAVSSADAEKIAEIARNHHVIWMSASSNRFSKGFVDAKNETNSGNVLGAQVYGPMAIMPTQPGLFWYGIHTVEMLYALFGKGCKEVSVTHCEDADIVVGTWKDGRIGTIRGGRKGQYAFGALIHREEDIQYVDYRKDEKPGYASLLDKIMPMFRTGRTAIDEAEMLEIIRFIEAANESRKSGKAIKL